MEDITVIIRSVKERTEQLCRKLLLDQGVPEEDLHIVHEVPFSASLKKSFSIGIEKEKEWTLCVDADILPRSGSVSKMVELAESSNRKVCEIQGYIMDKFFGGPRIGGYHLYRTSLLPEVITQIPQEGVHIRPESYTLRQMAKKGHPRTRVPYIIGIHDDEQFNYDIYRKAFVHAVKHLNHADLLVSHWKKNAEKDFDFYVALKAFSDSIQNTEDVFINSDQNLYKKLFEQAGFDEKDELPLSEISLDDIEARIQNWKFGDKYYEYYPNGQGLNSQKEVVLRKFKSSSKKRGIVKTILLMFSQIFLKIGKKLGSRVPE